MSVVAGQGPLKDLVTGSLAGDDFFDGTELIFVGGQTLQQISGFLIPGDPAVRVGVSTAAKP
jgi:hypothetical protein